MPNPNPANIPATRYTALVNAAMLEHNLSRREAEALIDPGLAPFPETPPAGMLTRAVAKMQNVWKGGKR